MENIKGLVLAGGKGTRLRPITYYIQKTMIPIGYKQKPLLEYIVRLLKFHGVTDITFLVNYKPEQIQGYFNNGSRFNVKIQYIYDTPQLRGTGGSVINAYKQGTFNEEDLVLVYYGDILTNMNLRDLLNFHKKKKGVVTVALASGFEVRVGLADLEKEGKIRGFIEKPKLEKPVSIGLLTFEGSALKDAQSLAEKKEELDLMGDIIPYLISQDKAVYGYLSEFFWYDIGSTEAYEKLNKDKLEESMSFLF